MTSIVLSFRIDKRLKEEAERLGIDIKNIVVKALEEEINRARRERFKKLLKEALNSIKFSEDEWIKDVRLSRDER